MTVRVETVRDAAGVAGSDAAALLALEAATQERPLTLATLLRESGPHGIVLVARGGPEAGASDDDGALVGFASARLLVDEVHVIRLAVDAAQRRRGTGRALLDGLVGWAEEVGATGIVLEVRAGNAAAQQLYATAGFSQDGRRPRYYPDGEDALLLRLPLVTRAGTRAGTSTGEDVATPMGGV
jgi:[ribosomal protein S18]-alanine N-acetyltransferase